MGRGNTLDGAIDVGQLDRYADGRLLGLGELAHRRGDGRPADTDPALLRLTAEQRDRRRHLLGSTVARNSAIAATFSFRADVAAVASDAATRSAKRVIGSLARRSERGGDLSAQTRADPLTRVWFLTSGCFRRSRRTACPEFRAR